MGKRIAIVEDDPDVRAFLEKCLSGDGYEVLSVARGRELEPILKATQPDLVILDIGLPDIDGLTLTRQIRDGSDVAIIIVSGRGDLTDRVVGLEIGADDYITKPFEPREVLARVRSVLRRGRSHSATGGTDEPGDTLTFNGWTIDRSAQTLLNPDGQPITLTSGEYRLLEALASRANRVLTRDQLLELIYSNDSPAFDRSIDVTIGRLRKKLGEDPKNPSFIRTVRNSGYIFIGKAARL
jgi:two-component system OmpR family response regulator